jgi:hypothetical protein
MNNIKKIANEIIISSKDINYDDKPIKTSLKGKTFKIQSQGFGHEREWVLIDARWLYNSGGGKMGYYTIKNDQGVKKNIPVTCDNSGDIKQTDKAFKEYIKRSGGI